MPHAIDIEVVKSLSGLHWWVVDSTKPAAPLAVRDTKWEAEDVAQDLRQVVAAAVRYMPEELA